MLRPYEDPATALPEDIESEATTAASAAGCMLYLKLCGFAALIVTSPFWLYQIWAFILPGLHAKERKWSRIFAAIAGPLFLAGVASATSRCPRAWRS